MNKFNSTGLRVLRPSRPKIALAAHQTHSKKHAPGGKRCVTSALVCGKQCCNCGAILTSHVCLRTHLKDSVRRRFFRASLARKGAQRNELWNSLRCAVLCVVRICQNMIRHSHTWLHTFAHSFHMVMWPVNHLILHMCHLRCLCVRCCPFNTNMIDSRRVLCSFECSGP